MKNFEENDEFRQALIDSASALSQGRAAEAETRLLPLYAQAPTHPDVAINLGGAYILQRKWNKAVRVLKPAADANSDNAMLWKNLGAAYLGRLELAGPKQQQQAIDAFEQAIKADPYAPDLHYNLGLIYKERGDLARAAEYFEGAIRVRPTDKDARYWLNRVTSLLSDIK